MKIRQGFALKEVSNQYIVLYETKEYRQNNDIIVINQSGKFLWDLLLDFNTKEDLIQQLCQHYQVTYQQALEDIEIFLSHLEKYQIIEFS
ncbi:MAG: PqqD family protein [Bacilli bacterium]|jgi:hypothetical protein|nr:PqqD family protein [Bacilli bacterium]